MTKFKPGSHYYTRSIGDHNCVFSILVASRTAQTISAYVDSRAEVKRFRIEVIEGNETIMPHGRYSMAPCIGSNKTERPLKDWEREKPIAQEIPVIHTAEPAIDCLIIESRLCEDCCNLYVHKEAEGFTDRDVCPKCFKSAMVASYGSQGAAIKSMETVRL
jgi:hypothetical protein